MRNLKDYYTFTAEAQKALDSFYARIKKAGAKIPARDIDELTESLNEHIEVSLNDKLGRSRRDVVDGQMMLEVLFALGEPEEIAAEFNAGSDENRAGQEAPGRSQAMPQAPAAERIRFKYVPVHKSLYKSTNDRWISGVCGGMAEYFGVSSLLTRFLFVFSGVGIFVYIVLALFLPTESQARNNENTTGVGLIVSAIRMIFLALMCIFYIPVIAALVSGLLLSLGRLTGEVVPFQVSLSHDIFGPIPAFILQIATAVASVSLLILVLNLISSIHFSWNFIRRGSRNVLILVSVIAAVAMAGVFSFFKTQNSAAAEVVESFAFKCDKSISVNFDEKEGRAVFYGKKVEISGEDGLDSIQVDIVRSSFGPSEELAREYAGDIIARTDDSTAGCLKLTAAIKDAGRNYYNFPGIKFIIRVPRKMECVIEDASEKKSFSWLSMDFFNAPGNYRGKRYSEDGVTLRNINGKIVVKLKTSNFSATGIKSESLLANLKVGNVELEKSEINDCSINNPVGNVKISSLSAGTLKCNSNVGNITIKGMSARTSEIETRVGNIRIDYSKIEPGSRHDITSQTGNIRLSIPAGSKPLISTKNSIGNTKNDFQSLDTVETGTPIVNVSNRIGNIRIEKEK